MSFPTTDLPAGLSPGADSIAYGSVQLDVVDGERSLGFWRDLLGLVEVAASDGVALGVDGRALIVLHPGARRGSLRGHAGLYHVALHLPGETELARVIARLAARRVPQAPTDHVFSKATYVSDPDGIGVELTVETPERFAGMVVDRTSVVIVDSEGRRRRPTEPLDVRELLALLADDDLDRPLPSGTCVGHVHLHVGHLEDAWRFYRDVVGFEEHQFLAALGMADLGAGGRFPHRLALNVWQGPGATQPPSGTAGLRRFELVVPDEEVLTGIRERLEEAGASYDLDGGSVVTHDPAGNTVSVGVAVAG